MTYGRNKKGRISEPKSRSKQAWERGKGARKIGNPRYKPSTCVRNGKRVKCYRVR